MERLIVPVRYPLTRRSKRTLSEAFSIARHRDAHVTILHVNLYQNGRRVSQIELQHAVETEFGHLPKTQYVVRGGVLVEETIIDEVIGEGADAVVIGHGTTSRWRGLVRRALSQPDVETVLQDRLDCQVIGVPV
jgi:nucleotide-binding universal stress UspA family protein